MRKVLCDQSNPILFMLSKNQLKMTVNQLLRGKLWPVWANSKNLAGHKRARVWQEESPAKSAGPLCSLAVASWTPHSIDFAKDVVVNRKKTTFNIKFAHIYQNGSKEEEADEALVLVRVSLFRIDLFFWRFLLGIVTVSLTMKRFWFNTKRPSISNATFATKSCTPAQACRFIVCKFTRRPLTR